MAPNAWERSYVGKQREARGGAYKKRWAVAVVANLLLVCCESCAAFRLYDPYSCHAGRGYRQRALERKGCGEGESLLSLRLLRL